MVSLILSFETLHNNLGNLNLIFTIQKSLIAMKLLLYDKMTLKGL